MRQERGRRNPEHQARLFEAPSGRPRWLNLPVDSQGKVIDLIARMLRHHRCQDALRAAHEVEDE